MSRNTDGINECADILDSRDIEGRIDELESLIDCIESDIEKAQERITKLEDLDRELTRQEDMEIGELRADVVGHLEEKEPLVEEHKELTDFRDEVGSREWRHGLQLVAESYFEEYARQFAEDIGALENCDKWPATCIDWEKAAEELQHDYSSAELRGHTFYYCG